jgi:hypothetical protein
MHMECVGLSCETTPVGDICTMPCDPLHPSIGCPPGLYCGHVGACDGRCMPGTAGTKGDDEECAADAECASLFCADPGDGVQRCLTPCRGDGGGCLDGEVCAAGVGECGGCVASDIVIGLRGLGEICDADGDCLSGACLEEGGARYCTRPCAGDEECGSGYHCRTSEMRCVRGDREGIGASCLVNEDCEDGHICVARGDVHWCTPFCGDAADCSESFSCIPAGGAMVCAPDGRLVGESCSVDADCISTLCAEVGSGSVCTRRCGPDAPCGTGFECRRTADGTDAVCVDASDPRPASDDGCGCRAAGSASRRGGALLALGGGLGTVVVLARTRRRRRSVS